MGIPATHIDEAQVVLIAHQRRHALGKQTEAFGTDGRTPCGVHAFLLSHALHRHLRGKALAGRIFKKRALVHGSNDGRAPSQRCGLAHRGQRHIRHIHRAAHRERHLRRKRHGQHAALAAPVGLQHLRQAVEKAGLVAPPSFKGLAQLNGVLRLKMAARQIIRACKWHKTGLALLIQGQQAALKRGVQTPLRVQRQRTIRFTGSGNGNRRPGLVIEVAMRWHQQAVAVIGSAQKHQQKAWRAALHGRCQPMAQIAGQRYRGAQIQKLASLHGWTPQRNIISGDDRK